MVLSPTEVRETKRAVCQADPLMVCVEICNSVILRLHLFVVMVEKLSDHVLKRHEVKEWCIKFHPARQEKYGSNLHGAESTIR